MKRQVAEQVLPVVLGLRQVLQAARSSAMGALLGYIKTLLEDYGDEIHGAESMLMHCVDGPPRSPYVPQMLWQIIGSRCGATGGCESI